MAQLCFRILRNTSPQFNICNLISSYISDSEIEEIGTALDRAVPADLFYAAQHWAIHLQYVIRPTELIQELEEFLAVRLLLWMEIMNLKKCAYKMPEVLRLTKEWDESRAHCPAHVRALIHDAWQFTTIFASSGVSISTPHIYTSMLLFWPDSSPIANYYARRFTASIQLEGTAIAQRRRALLATWHFDHATRSPVYSPDGTLIAVGVGDDVLLLSAWTGRVVFRPLKGHKGIVLSIQFSPDGDCIVSGSTDKTVRLWSTLNGRSIAGPLDGHDGNVNSVAFSPDGTRIVSGAHDGTICIWNCGDGKRLFGPLIGFHESINEIKYSRNGSQMVTCGRRGAALRNAEDGNLLKEFLPGNGDNSFRSVDISPDSTRIVSGSINNGIYVWEIQSGQLISSLSTSILVGRARNPFISVSFSPDGKHLISTLPCGIVGFWDIQTGKLALDPLKGHTDNITSVRFSPNGAFVVSGSYDKTLRLWNIRNVQAEPNSLQGHDDSVTSVAFSPAGTHLVSGSNDQTIYVWDIMRKQMVLGPLEKSSNDKVSIAYSPDGTRIISHSRDGLVVLDAQTGNIAFGPFQSLQPIQSVSFSPDGTRIILGSTNNALHILAVDTGETIMNICPPLNDQSNWVHVTSAVFSPDGSRIAVGSMHSNLMMFDAHNGMLLYDPLEGHTNGSRSLGFSPDSTRIACGSFSVVLVWDVESGRLVLGPLEGHTGRINSVEYSPDGTYIVSGARDNAVCIWNAQTGEPVLGLSKWHTAPVRSVKFSPDRTQVVSGSDDKTIRVTDIREEFRYVSWL
ncbi:quinon protein alcohol dehydrogenase-like superfamily [Rhizoctonia solani]|nr:quinon protein alcohol dehydrogenase-like superfamily [Rhizoctonia solani]